MSLAKTGTRPGRRPGPEYSQGWMREWVETAAAGSLSLKDVCDKVGISLTEYHRGRMTDLAFDAAALVFDQILDLVILSSVRFKAIDGDPKAQTLYYGKARLPAFVPGFASWRPSRPDDDADGKPLAPEVAAGVKAAERAERVGEARPPATSPARSRKPPAPR